VEWLPWLAALSGLSGIAALMSAWLVYRRAGQSVEVAEGDSESKRFEVISAGQERLRLALLARLDEVERDSAKWQGQVAALTEQIAALQARYLVLEHAHQDCLRDQARHAVRVDELERIVRTLREDRARAEGNATGRVELQHEQAQEWERER